MCSWEGGLGSGSHLQVTVSVLCSWGSLLGKGQRGRPWRAFHILEPTSLREASPRSPSSRKGPEAPQRRGLSPTKQLFVHFTENRVPPSSWEKGGLRPKEMNLWMGGNNFLLVKNLASFRRRDELMFLLYAVMALPEYSAPPFWDGLWDSNCRSHYEYIYYSINW